jgi:small GTP-binding protein
MIPNNNFSNQSPMYLVKICLLGQGAVGKTCIARRLCFDSFESTTQLTIGVDFYTYDLPLIVHGEKTFIRLSIWDFGGQEQFRKFFLYYLSGANGIVLVFSLVDLNTLISLDWWYEKLKENNHQNTPRIIVGTKYDLLNAVDAKQKVNDLVIKRFLKKHNDIDFLKTSSKTNFNIDFCFKEIVRKILDHYNFKYDKVL